MGAELSCTVDATTIWPAQIIDRADVVETTASDKVARRCIGAGHDPRGAKGDCVNLVRSVGVPDDEFAVLRSRYKMPPVLRPMHSIDLCKMATE